MAKKIRFKIHTLGCKVNQYDAAVLANYLSRDGWFEIKDEKTKPDLIIINSCSVTVSAIAKSRRLLNSWARREPRAKLVLVGCWPKIYPLKNLAADLILKHREVKRNSEEIKKLFSPLETISRPADSSACFLNTISDRSRYFIKIQDGCQQFCSYCVIPLARGPLVSRPANDIIQEIDRAGQNGFQEIVLSGIHLGLYGRDFSGSKENLCSLLRKILRIKNIGRLRLSSIEINEVSDELIDLMAGESKICRHLHLPLQSGSDKILKLMNRPYDIKYFSDRVKKIRRKMPSIAISSDVIVGFPGESQSDFSRSYDFCRKMALAQIHVFSFSLHPQAPAFNFSRRVAESDIKERSLALRRLSGELSADYKKDILNRYDNLLVLVENINRGMVKAKSEFYFDLSIPLKDFLKKQHLSLSSDPACLIGRLFQHRL